MWSSSNVFSLFLQKHRENRQKLPWEHLIHCQGVKLFLLKYVKIPTLTPATVTSVTVTIVTIRVFLKLCHNVIFEFGHNLRFRALSQFEFWSFVTIWFCWVLSQFEFFKFCYNLSFLRYVTIWVFELCHTWCFSVLSQFDFVEICHNKFFFFSFFLFCHKLSF